MKYNLCRNDLEDILKLVDFCMTRVKMGNVDSKDLLEKMLKIFRSDDAEFFPSNQSLDGADLSNTFSIKEERASLTNYINYYWRYDPLYSAQFSPAPVKRVFKTDDIISYSQLQRLEYYQKYLRKINWFSELVIRLCTDDSFWGTMSLSRSPKQPYFDHTDIQKAEFLLPYLINTFETTMLFSKINEECKAFEQWLESKPDGIILLDEKLRFLYCNNNARLLCQSLSGISTEALSKNQNTNVTLPRMIVEDCKYLLNNFLKNGSIYHNRIINTKFGERYYIRYTFIKQSHQEVRLPCFIIHINNLSKAEDKAEVTLLRDYELSAREEIIVQYAGGGLSNKEIAEELCISPFTVQNHLKNIFEKTGLKNRTKLANLVK